MAQRCTPLPTRCVLRRWAAWPHRLAGQRRARPCLIERNEQRLCPPYKTPINKRVSVSDEVLQMADATVKRTGVIGLGAMGLQMARHMVNKGFEVSGYDVSADAAKNAESHGVRICGSPPQVARTPPRVLLTVPTPHP